MKLQFNGYEIEIKAKHSYDERASKACTLEILNDLALLYHDSADLHEKLEDGDGVYLNYAKLQRERADIIHKYLSDNNLYN